MNEILEKLLSSELLNEETKLALRTAFTEELEVAKAAAREDAIAEVKVELAAQFANDKAALVEAIDTKIGVMLKSELQELKEDIERFRDLEAEYATKLVESKEAIGLQLRADMAQLVEMLDVFVERRLGAELLELKESIEEVRKIEFAKNLFESIEDAFRTKFFDANGVTAKLEESRRLLEDRSNKLQAVEAQLNKLVREKEMTRVLEPLHGRPREIMEAILQSVSTNRLDEAYTNFIGRVLDESVKVVEPKSEKETAPSPVLAEGHSTVIQSANTKVVYGNLPSEQVDETKRSYLSEGERLRLKKMAGIS